LIGGWWGEAALGSFSLVTTALFVFGVLGACGIQYSVLRAIAEAPDDRDRVAAVVVGALVPNVVIAAAATTIFVWSRESLGSWLESDAVAEGMLVAAPGLFCFAINKTLMGIVNGLRRMRAFAVYTSIRYLLIAVGVIGARVWGIEAAQLPVIWTIVEGTLLLVLIGELVTQVALTRGRGWYAHAREHLEFGIRGVTATLAFDLNSRIDIWMLGIVYSDAVVGVYSVAAALREGVMQLGVVMQNNLDPKLAHAIATGRPEDLEQLARRTRRWFVPCIIAICVIGAASYPFVIPGIVGNPVFVEGALPFAIMMAGIALASPYLPFIHVLLMASRPGWHTAYVVVMLGLSCLGCQLLIGPLAHEGAAVAIAVSLVASVLVLRWFARLRVGVRL
jgi:stage V sporulation protein B